MQGHVSLATASVSELVGFYNQLAITRGVEPLTDWSKPRINLVERVALLRAQRTVQAKPCEQVTVAAESAAPVRRSRPSPIMDEALRQLARIWHWEHRATGKTISNRSAPKYPREELYSVGFPYNVLLAAIRRKFPDSRISGSVLRSYSTYVRNKDTRYIDYTRCTLPDKRPHGTKRMTP